MDGPIRIQSDAVLCKSCTHCGDSCNAAPDSHVRDCPDFEWKLSDIDILQNVSSEPPILCDDCIVRKNCYLPERNVYTCAMYKSEKQAQEEAEQLASKRDYDHVNHPSHYTQGGIECIKCIEASMKPDGFQDYCKGNVIKYIHRWREKGGIEDLKKAAVYLNWMIESAENGRIA